ncbi:MAG: prefoldin subunit alpha [Candidatus Woesearchaeota archaeon]
MSDLKEKQQEVQQKYSEFQMLQQQMKQINENMEQVTERIEEISKIISNLDSISKIENGNEILVPISNGIFIKAKTVDTKEFLVNVGSKTVVKKDKKGVVDLLEKQKSELIALQNDMIKDLGDTENNIMILQDELKSIIGKNK